MICLYISINSSNHNKSQHIGTKSHFWISALLTYITVLVPGFPIKAFCEATGPSSTREGSTGAFVENDGAVVGRSLDLQVRGESAWRALWRGGYI